MPCKRSRPNSNSPDGECLVYSDASNSELGYHTAVQVKDVVPKPDCVARSRFILLCSQCIS